MNDAFVEMAKDMLVEAKRQNKRLFCALIILICIMFAMIVAFFAWFNSVDTSITTTTIEQAAANGSQSQYLLGQIGTYYTNPSVNPYTCYNNCGCN